MDLKHDLRTYSGFMWFRTRTGTRNGMFWTTVDYSPSG